MLFVNNTNYCNIFYMQKIQSHFIYSSVAVSSLLEEKLNDTVYDLSDDAKKL